MDSSNGFFLSSSRNERLIDIHLYFDSTKLSPYKVGQGPILVVLILERMGIEN